MTEKTSDRSASESRADARASESKPAPSGPRTPASESGDPEVHQLLARLDSHRITFAAQDQTSQMAEADRKAAEEEVKAIHERLHELGYDAG
jgi:hypothetical protein